MCNSQKLDNLREVQFEPEHPIVDQHHQAVYIMDNPAVTPGSALSTTDDKPRVKFLCSFSGSILPRPQDGKLRYVGGETRIVSVPRDITYEELMGKMRELLEGATLLKYQQPDEDLDALVSVVNDDDVTNMMEEYDKLGSGDGFTRLRIFLFLHPDQDGSLHFGDGDERDNERRYVDALNSLNESPEFRKQPGESLVTGSFDDVHIAEQYFSQMNLEGSFHGQRNMELPMAQMNLRHLTIPHLGSGQPQQPVAQRFNEMEAPWSPGYYSPRQPGNIDQRPIAEYPTSPSSSRCRTPYGDFAEKIYPEDYNRPPINNQSIFEQQPQYSDNVVLISTGPVVNEKAGFPGNILHGSSVYEGNNICEQCRMTFQRNPVYPESSWKPSEQSHLESLNMGNGYLHVPNSCSECPPNREMYMLNTDVNMHAYYCKDQSDSRFMHPKNQSHERGWISPHQSNPWAEESRLHIPVSGRLADNYPTENGTSIPLGHGNVCDGHHVQSPYIHHEDQRYARSGVDYGSQVFQDQVVATGSQIHLPSIEERNIRYGNPPYKYGDDNLYQVPHGHVPSQTLWRNGVPSFETSVSPQLVNGSVGTGFIRGTVEGSPRVQTVLENQNPWTEASQKLVSFNGSLMPEHFHLQAVKLTPKTHTLENHHQYGLEPIQSTVNGNSDHEGSKDTNHGGEAENSGLCGVIYKNSDDAVAQYASINSNVPVPAVENGGVMKVDETNGGAHEKSPDDLEFVPEVIASLEEVALQSLKEMKPKVQEDADLASEHNEVTKEHAHNESDGVDASVDLEVDFDNANVNSSKIEPTKAEAEAIDQGLQTIKNEDLEEIRELGSGTYGAVFHGKWKGSDVAIKRIKASCFAGRPSERERLAKEGKEVKLYMRY